MTTLLAHEFRPETPPEILPPHESGCERAQDKLAIINDASLSEVDSLLDAVICDGRFLAVLQERPREVAAALACRISDEGVREVSVTPLSGLLDHLYRAKFGKLNSKEENALAFPEAVVPFIAVGIVVVSICIVLIVVITWTITRDRRGQAKDKSPNRDSKL